MKTVKALLLLASCCLVAAVCGKSGSRPGPATGSATQASGQKSASSTSSGAPATLTDVNLAAEDVGGLIESISGNGVLDFMRHRLIDGKQVPPWKTPQTFTWNSEVWPKFPTDIVFSFFDRQSAL